MATRSNDPSYLPFYNFERAHHARRICGDPVLSLFGAAA